MRRSDVNTAAELLLAILISFTAGLYLGVNHGAEQYKQDMKAKQAALNRMTLESVILDYELGNIKCEHNPAVDPSLECDYVLENSK